MHIAQSPKSMNKPFGVYVSKTNKADLADFVNKLTNIPNIII